MLQDVQRERDNFIPQEAPGLVEKVKTKGTQLWVRVRSPSREQLSNLDANPSSTSLLVDKAIITNASASLNKQFSVEESQALSIINALD